MRYDAYRLPGVKWISPGIGKGAPQPDCWPSHVMIEGVRVKTVRGKGWGWSRAFYECPECELAVKSLYSQPCRQCKGNGWLRALPDDVRCRQCDGAGALVQCGRHVSRDIRAREDAKLAAERVREKAQKYRPDSRNWRTLEAQARDLDNAQLVE